MRSHFSVLYFSFIWNHQNQSLGPKNKIHASASSCNHSLSYCKGFGFDQMLLKFFHVKLSFAFFFDTQNTASSLTAVLGAGAA